jgi:hypothetical protein
MTEKGLSEKYHYQYLILWYAGGLVFGLIWFLATRGRFRTQELVMSFGIGMASFGGQLFSLLALEKDVPGYIVFPMTTGGNLFLVAAAGVFLFRERSRRLGPASAGLNRLASAHGRPSCRAWEHQVNPPTSSPSVQRAGRFLFIWSLQSFRAGPNDAESGCSGCPLEQLLFETQSAKRLEGAPDEERTYFEASRGCRRHLKENPRIQSCRRMRGFRYLLFFSKPPGTKHGVHRRGGA